MTTIDCRIEDSFKQIERKVKKVGRILEEEGLSPNQVSKAIQDLADLEKNYRLLQRVAIHYETLKKVVEGGYGTC